MTLIIVQSIPKSKFALKAGIHVYTPMIHACLGDTLYVLFYGIL